MALEIVSRDQELASLHAFVGREDVGPAALVLEGEAGIGKSTLWIAGVEHARALRLHRPLVATRGGGAAASLMPGWATCSRTSSTTCCPRCRRRGVLRSRSRSSARRRPRTESTPGRSGSRLATPCSCSPQTARSSSRSTTSQWFDDSSARALAFALRRLGRERHAPAARPAARRRAAAGGARAGARRGDRPAAAAGTAQRRRAAPVPARPARQALRAPDAAPHPRDGRAGTRSSRSSWPASSTRTSTRSQPLPVPETLDELVRARIDGLPKPDPRRARARLGAGHAVGVAPGARGRRRARRSSRRSPRSVIERENGTIRFTHPLLSSVIYQDLRRGATERPRTHRGDRRRPAHPGPSPRAVEGRAGRRGRRACSTSRPRLAADRGASDVAAELAEQALRLTPADEPDERHRRALAAAQRSSTTPGSGRAPGRSAPICWPRHGDRARCAPRPRPPCRAREHDLAVALLEEALREAASRPALQSPIHMPARVGDALQERILRGARARTRGAQARRRR